MEKQVECLGPAQVGGLAPYREEDEINLLDLYLVVLKHKWFIAVATVAVGIAAVVASLLMSNIYRPSATITPQTAQQPSSSSLSSLASSALGGAISGFLGLGGNSDLGNLQVILLSRDLTQRIITKYDLLPVLLAGSWKQTIRKWLGMPPPTVQDGIELISQDLLTVTTDDTSKTLTLSFDDPNPGFAKLMVDRYLSELSEIMREEVLRSAAEKSAVLRQELEMASDALMREKVAELLASQIETMTFAKVQKYYNFEVIDPPVVPDVDKKVKPKRALICVLAVIGGFFLAVFAAFFREFLHNIKANAAPEQLARLQQYGWRRKRQAN